MHYMAPETREIGYSSTTSEQTNENENNPNSNASSTMPSQTNLSVNSQSIATINLNKNNKTTAVDIYAFGIVALEVSIYFRIVHQSTVFQLYQNRKRNQTWIMLKFRANRPLPY